MRSASPIWKGWFIAILLGVAIRTVWKAGADGGRAAISFQREKRCSRIAVVLLGGLDQRRPRSGRLGRSFLIGNRADRRASPIASSYLILPRAWAYRCACRSWWHVEIRSAATRRSRRSLRSSARDADDIASSICLPPRCSALVVVLGLPLFVPLLSLSLTQYGVLAGLTVLCGAAGPRRDAFRSERSAIRWGTVVKLVRVLMPRSRRARSSRCLPAGPSQWRR